MKRIIYLAVAGLLAAACAREPVFEADLQADRQDAIFGAEVPEEDLIPDEMNVLVNEETAAILEAATGEDGYVEMSRVKAFSDLGVVKMRRLFPYAGKFEPRTRAEGMHLWYVVTRSGDSPMTKAAGSVLALPGVDVVELKPQDMPLLPLRTPKPAPACDILSTTPDFLPSGITITTAPSPPAKAAVTSTSSPSGGHMPPAIRRS